MAYTTRNKLFLIEREIFHDRTTVEEPIVWSFFIWRVSFVDNDREMPESTSKLTGRLWWLDRKRVGLV